MWMTGQAFGLLVNHVAVGKLPGGTSKSAWMLPPTIPAQSSLTLALICAKVLVVSSGGDPCNAVLLPLNCPPEGIIPPATAGLPPRLAAGHVALPPFGPPFPSWVIPEGPHHPP